MIDGADALIKWHDYFPVLILIIIKMKIQIWYYQRGHFDFGKEWVYLMDEFLRNKYDI